jgi:hypothetical protein
VTKKAPGKSSPSSPSNPASERAHPPAVSSLIPSTQVCSSPPFNI